MNEESKEEKKEKIPFALFAQKTKEKRQKKESFFPSFDCVYTEANTLKRERRKLFMFISHDVSFEHLFVFVVLDKPILECPIFFKISFKFCNMGWVEILQKKRRLNSKKRT
eukprot:scaffold5782_cov618-Prasinococcus_capsulatus_cf.AAC.2